jgi:malonyl-CoA/methylmalonyl-CoA synthetase
VTDYGEFVKNTTYTLPVFTQAQSHAGRVAAIDAKAAYTYDELLCASERVAATLLTGRNDLNEARVAFLIPPSIPWIATFWGVWMAGGIAVPLPLHAARPELEYIFDDTGATTLVYDASTADVAEAIIRDRGITGIRYESIASDVQAVLPALTLDRRALILYTSGTTNKPKGVVTTHANIKAQITTLVDAWEWRSDDRIPLFLPLHHVHGIINVVSCALWSGATVEMMQRFDVDVVWERIASGEITLLMAVPTIYHRLIATWESASPERQVELSHGCAKIRLMVSGSAALPVSTLEHWKKISGHILLERYGMTEIGMAISNPLHGRRIPGSVGNPLPGVEVQLTADDGTLIEPGNPGEIEVRGPSVFAEYWGKPEATRNAFRNGWFRTGDTAVFENGAYRILGRSSIDILKTGGHKVSALEIEEVLRQHPAIVECAVVGVPDEEWGERVGAALILRPGTSLDLPTLREWAREKLSAHKLPSLLMILETLPRNAMGKMLKPAITKLFIHDAK